MCQFGHSIIPVCVVMMFVLFLVYPYPAFSVDVGMNLPLETFAKSSTCRLENEFVWLLFHAAVR